MSRRTVLWDGMGFPSTRHGWMAALLASFLALFVLVSAADAFACAPETGSLQGLAASDVVAVSDTGHGERKDAAGQVACAHGHCHHCGITAPPAIDDMRSMALDRAPLAPSLDQAPASRMPAGPMRPPRT
ncbi:MAG: hypothetical protein ACI8Y6_001089 [Brevundimonas sp.]|jgi:hypothetical protein